MTKLQFVFAAFVCLCLIVLLIMTGLGRGFNPTDNQSKLILSDLSTLISAVASINRGGGLKSPVRVVGGSVTTHSRSGWSLSYPFTTKGSLDTSIISIDGAQPGAGAPPDGLTCLSDNWEIDVYEHNGAQTEGVKLCSMADCSLNKPLNSYVTLQGLGPNSQFYATDAKDDIDANDIGKRFKDKGYSGPPDDRDLTERIASFVIKVGPSKSYNYTCPEGQCRIFIGK